MSHHNLSVTPVVMLPKGFTDVQVGATTVVKSCVGGDPPIALEHIRKLLKTMQPLVRETVSKLAVGIHRQEVGMAVGGGAFESQDQGLLMVAAQPGGPSFANQLPDQIHAVGNGWSSVDHITAEHQVVVARKNRQQTDQGFMAPMHITDNPVVFRRGCHCYEQSLEILPAERVSVSGRGYGEQLSSLLMDPRSLPVARRVALLVQALDGAKKTNEALARCNNGEEMLDVLQGASQKLGLGLTREQLANTPPIRDWVWWKNKEAPITIGR